MSESGLGAGSASGSEEGRMPRLHPLFYTLSGVPEEGDAILFDKIKGQLYFGKTPTKESRDEVARTFGGGPMYAPIGGPFTAQVSERRLKEYFEAGVDRDKLDNPGPGLNPPVGPAPGTSPGSFQWAMDALLQGKRVQREGWREMHICPVMGHGNDKVVSMVLRSGSHTTFWSATFDILTSNDWQEYED